MKNIATLFSPRLGTIRFYTSILLALPASIAPTGIFTDALFAQIVKNSDVHRTEIKNKSVISSFLTLSSNCKQSRRRNTDDPFARTTDNGGPKTEDEEGSGPVSERYSFPA